MLDWQKRRRIGSLGMEQIEYLVQLTKQVS
jgi:hypothetical protein